MGDRAGRLFALNLADGSQRWTDQLKGQLLTTPIVASEMILVAPSSGDNLLVAYTTTGAQKWAFAPSK